MAPGAEDPTKGSDSVSSSDASDKHGAASEDAAGAADGVADSMSDAVEEAAANGGESVTSENEGGNDDVKAKKRKERLEQNRISARESRKRKKNMIEELQRTVITLSKENKELTDRNDQLRTQLMEIASKVSSPTEESFFAELHEGFLYGLCCCMMALMIVVVSAFEFYLICSIEACTFPCCLFLKFRHSHPLFFLLPIVIVPQCCSPSSHYERGSRWPS